MMTDAAGAPADVAAALVALGEPRAMRRGSLTTRLMKCGQPSCACQEDPAARHGPYIEWSRVVGGRRRSRYLTEEQAERVRAQITAGHDFRRAVESLWEAAERWADAELSTETTAVAGEGAERGGSGTSSPTRSRRSSSR